MEFIKGAYGTLRKGELLGAGVLCTFLCKRYNFPDGALLFSLVMTSLGVSTLLWHILQEDSAKREMSRCEQAAGELRQMVKSKEGKSPEEIMDEVAAEEERQQAAESKELSEEPSEIADKSPSDGKTVSQQMRNISRRLKICADKIFKEKVQIPGTSHNDEKTISQEMRDISRKLKTWADTLRVHEKVKTLGTSHDDEKTISQEMRDLSRRLKTCADKLFREKVKTHGTSHNDGKGPEGGEQNSAENPGLTTDGTDELKYAAEVSPLKHESGPSSVTETVDEVSESDKWTEPDETSDEIFQRIKSGMKRQIRQQQMLADETAIVEGRPLTTQNEESEGSDQMTRWSPEEGEEGLVPPEIAAACAEHLKACAEEFGHDAATRPARVISSSSYDGKVVDEEFDPSANMGTGNDQSENKMVKPAETTCEEEEGVGRQSSPESYDPDNDVFVPNHTFESWSIHRANLARQRRT